MHTYLWLIGVATSLGLAIYLAVARLGYAVFSNIRAHAKNRRYEIFVHSIQASTDNIELQDELWNLLRRYHPFLTKGEGLINASYFSKTVGEFFNGKLSFQPQRTQFALAAKSEWLRSENPEFGVTAILNSEKRSVPRTIKGAAKRFLESVNVPEGGLPALLKSLHVKCDNNDTFDLADVSITEDNLLKLHLVLGKYHDFVSLNELLRRELNYYALRNPTPTIWERFFYRHRLRAAFNVKSVSDAFDVREHPATLGLSVFTIFNHGAEERFSTFLQHRATNVTEYPSCMHVVPAGTHQPLSTFVYRDKVRQCYLGLTVIRECLEELYNVREAEWDQSRDPFSIFDMPSRDRNNVPTSFVPGRLFLPQELQTVFSGADQLPLVVGERFRIVPTALTIDLLNMKPELALVLYVQDPEIYQRSREFFRENWEGSIREYEIWPSNTELADDVISQHLNIDQFLPDGAVALAEGLSYFNRVILPNERGGAAR